jgi:hypothetical protein
MWFWYPARALELLGYTSPWIMQRETLHCYRLTDRNDYDEEAIWSLVQRHGGFIAIRPNYIDFWMAAPWDELLIIAYPNLERRPEQDRH